MTRGMFFKVLAAFGFEQDCFQPDRHGNLKSEPCEFGHCKEGEESCPLGHCQKPHMLMVVASPTGNSGGLPYLYDSLNGRIPQICSECGMVYVKQESAKPSKP